MGRRKKTQPEVEETQSTQEEAEAQRPRVQPGARVTDIDQVRAGDFLAKSWGPKYKVLRTTPKSVFIVEVDANGRPLNGREKRFTRKSNTLLGSRKS